MLSRILTIVAVLGFAGAVTASPAAAQSNGDATLYGHGNFRGGGLVLSGARERMDPVQVESLQLAPGSAWELCSGRTFTGCRRFSESRKSMVMTVRSARPVEGAIPESATASGEGLKGSGASLRGLASEFFVMPDEGGSRVEVGGTAGALPQRATEFCRSHGWRESPYQREQSVGGRSYLVDVLCADAAR
jgi:hypothetical protein